MDKRRRIDEQQVYRIRVQGRLDERWSEWFSGLAVTVENVVKSTPVTILTGALDQAALRGVLNRLWDLHVTLISIVPLNDQQSCDGGDK